MRPTKQSTDAAYIYQTAGPSSKWKVMSTREYLIWRKSAPGPLPFEPLPSEENMEHELCTPRFTLASCNDVSFQIIEDNDFAWHTSSILVPVKWSEEFLPFRVVPQGFQPPSHIEIVMEKKPRVPVLMMKVGGFGSLPSLFNFGVMHAVVVGKEVASYSFEHKSDSLQCKEVGMTEDEIVVCDKFFANFLDEMGYGLQTGSFKVDVFWKVSFEANRIAHLNNFLAYTSPEIQNLEGTVILQSGSGEKGFKISKGILAVFSMKFKAQFEFSLGSTSEITLHLDDTTAIGEESLLPFIKFLCGYNLTEPLNKCSIAVDLLMAAHYNIVPEMEKAMQTILLIKPTCWFDMKTSLALFCHASKISSMIIGEGAKTAWENLKWKALRNLKWATLTELKEYEETATFIMDPVAFEMFTSLKALA